MKAKPVRYMGFDPGSTVGYAYFTATGETVHHGELPYSMMMQQLAMMMQAPVDSRKNLVIICEDFKLLTHKANNVARNPKSRSMEASKIIGALELFAASSNAEFILQEPEKGTRVAAAWTGLIVPPNKHLSDWKSAYNHATYHMVNAGILKVDEVRVQ